MEIKPILVAVGLGALIMMAAVHAKQLVNLRLKSAVAGVEVTLPTQNGVGVVFEGDAPVWADEAIAVMAELEQWRGKAFNQNLRVAFQPQSDEGGAGWFLLLRE